MFTLFDKGYNVYVVREATFEPASSSSNVHGQDVVVQNAILDGVFAKMPIKGVISLTEAVDALHNEKVRPFPCMVCVGLFTEYLLVSPKSHEELSGTSAVHTVHAVLSNQ